MPVPLCKNCGWAVALCSCPSDDVDNDYAEGEELPFAEFNRRRAVERAWADEARAKGPW